MSLHQRLHMTTRKSLVKYLAMATPRSTCTHIILPVRPHILLTSLLILSTYPTRTLPIWCRQRSIRRRQLVECTPRFIMLGMILLSVGLTHSRFPPRFLISLPVNLSNQLLPARRYPKMHRHSSLRTLHQFPICLIPSQATTLTPRHSMPITISGNHCRISPHLPYSLQIRVTSTAMHLTWLGLALRMEVGHLVVPLPEIAEDLASMVDRNARCRLQVVRHGIHLLGMATSAMAAGLSATLACVVLAALIPSSGHDLAQV